MENDSKTGDWKEVKSLGPLITDSNPPALTMPNPQGDSWVCLWGSQAFQLSIYAQQRVITSADDLKAAADDIILITNIRKQVREKLVSYIEPFVDYVDEVKAAFKLVLDPLEEAWQINRAKSNAYLMEQKRKAAEAEAINQAKEELAAREAALRGMTVTDSGVVNTETGEVVTPLEKMVVPTAIRKVYSETGNMGLQENWQWELVDIKIVPIDYLMVNAGILTRVVKASKGKVAIPGIRIYNAGGIRVTQR